MAGLKLLLLIGIVATGSTVAYRVGWVEYGDLASLAGALRELREMPGITVLFLAFFTLGAGVGLPGSVLSMLGGAIFGVALGTALNWLGATLGATAAFALARTLGRPTVHALLGRRSTRLDELATAHGFRTLLRLRLLPLIPYNALNFGAGLAGMRGRDYVVATGLGIIPGVAIYTFFADALLAGVEGARRQAFAQAAVAGAVLVALSLLPTLGRRFARRAARGPAQRAGSRSSWPV